MLLGSQNSSSSCFLGMKCSQKYPPCDVASLRVSLEEREGGEGHSRLSQALIQLSQLSLPPAPPPPGYPFLPVTWHSRP